MNAETARLQDAVEDVRKNLRRMLTVLTDERGASSVLVRMLAEDALYRTDEFVQSRKGAITP